ncbi:putative cysteine-rich PDZ-binding protein [Monocercomonoides exilis]|uniref:putative cysteine-rich PDZ-binding protein n=1 Tax=Monocercomonoides exilis TaxID=2049356 RepID=UPI0035597771|nr:putative cysteine-rich PDZ-binding protein [Monocercomonoides exilis]|eukprot:MONOS_1656.1-p1 / transcript=MONOS_1656.1 / gene=MONOS_1656 / organism=Monocercomonoides_exilis_PA203 / gene_product=Os08g0190800 / transcript_product=Os08g0190800 / location=Mono_scaffold00030:148167-148593(-) / protein_length=93 / sequence_SO=supercontig / SO=protein_coding / is_pseudo=false
MVCAECEKKLAKLATPERWRSGSRNVVGGGRKLGADTRLTSKFTPYDKRCIICKTALSQDAKYCLRCAHSKGVCAMCGKKIDDRSLRGSRYKQ